ncbi:MAG TPA: ABC transporter substrate-binding protein [Actinomycetota bacterium]
MSRTTRKTFGAVGILALALAACSTSGGGTGLSGTYTIGVWGPASIPQGGDIRDGAMLAAQELNDAGTGAGGREIKIIFCDSIDGASTAEAVDCVKGFIQDDGVDAIVGGFSSGETLAVLQTVVDGETIFVATGAASPDVVAGVESGGERRFIFRIGPINSTYLAIDMCGTMLKLAAQLGFGKFGILFEDVEFARPLKDFLAACLANPSEATQGAIPQETGVEVVSVKPHAFDATDFSSQFSAFEKKGAQIVIEINSRQEGVALVRQWGETRPPFALVGINVASQFDAFFEQTEGNAAYELNGPAGSTRAPLTPETIPFYDAFMAEYGRNPIYNGLSSYDAVHALAEAVERAGSAETDAVITEMEATDRVGTQGRERFGPDHDILYGPLAPDGEGIVPVYFQWQEDGTKVLVFPEELAGGATYTLPPWLS